MPFEIADDARVDLLALVEEVDKQVREALKEPDAGARILRKPLESLTGLFGLYQELLNRTILDMQRSREALADLLDKPAGRILDKLDLGKQQHRGLDVARRNVGRLLRDRSDVLQRHQSSIKVLLKELDKATDSDSSALQLLTLKRCQAALPSMAIAILLLDSGGSFAFGGVTATVPAGVGQEVLSGLLSALERVLGL